MTTALELWDKLRQQQHSWLPTGQVFAFVLTPNERETVLAALHGVPGPDERMARITVQNSNGSKVLLTICGKRVWLDPDESTDFCLADKVRSELYVPDVDGERYRAIRDKGIAFSAWQDENGVQWAVNGRVGKDLDALVDEELLKRGISPETTK